MRIGEYLKDRNPEGLVIFGGTLSNGRPFALYADIGIADGRSSFSAESNDFRIISSFSPEAILDGCMDGKSLFASIEGLSDCIAISQRLDSGRYEIGMMHEQKRVSWSYENTPGFGHIVDSTAIDREPEVIAIGDSAASFIDAFYSSIKDRCRAYICAFYDGAVRIIDDRARPL